MDAVLRDGACCGKTHKNKKTKTTYIYIYADPSRRRACWSTMNQFHYLLHPSKSQAGPMFFCFVRSAMKKTTFHATQTDPTLTPPSKKYYLGAKGNHVLHIRRPLGQKLFRVH